MPRKSLQPVKTPAFLEDLQYIASIIAADNETAAQRFVDCVERTVLQVAAAPDIGSQCHFKSPEAQGLRVIGIDRYPQYLLYFRRIEDCLEVIRLLHGNRDQHRQFEQQH